MGSLCVGKSTLLNTLGANFETSNAVDGCTKVLQSATLPGLKLIDSPGLHDLDMQIPEWAAKLNESGLKGSPINLCLLVFK